MHVFTAGVADKRMWELAVKFLVAKVFIRRNQADTVRDNLTDKRAQFFAVNLVNHTGNDVTFALDSTDNSDFLFATSAAKITSTSRAFVLVLSFAAYVGFVYFNVAHKLLKFHIAKGYADFVHGRPLYEFSFAKPLRGLWSENGLWGPHLFRKWERRAFLSLGYAVEGVYCSLITWGTHAVYGVESADTYARIENAPAGVLAENPHVRRVRDAGADGETVIIPRDQKFTETAQRLAKAGARFLNIAGNQEILLTVLEPLGTTFSAPEAQIVFTAELPARPGFRRLGVRCAVRPLHTVLNAFEGKAAKLEHIYDF